MDRGLHLRDCELTGKANDHGVLKRVVMRANYTNPFPLSLVVPVNRYATRILTIATLFAVLLCSSGVAANADTQVVPLDASSFDQQLAGKKTYDFVVLPTGELIVSGGERILFKRIPRYLKQTKPDKGAFFVFWIGTPEHLPLVRLAIESFTKFGANQFAVRSIPPGDPKGNHAPNAGPGGTKKSLILVGKPNPGAITANDTPPSFAGRPEHLRPGQIPHRVRCKFASDAAVETAAQHAQQLLLSTEPINPALLKEMMLIHPGAWKHLKKMRTLADSRSVETGVQLGSKVLKIEARFLNTAAQGGAAVERLRKLIAADKGGAIRAMTSREMDDWWTFIGFDIEEPVFILQTKRNKFRFVLHFDEQGRIALIDELNALPGTHVE